MRMIVGQDSDGKIHEGKIVRAEFISKLSDRLVIVPAAGFGTRVGSPQAKELMLHPLFGVSFLEKCLERIANCGATPLVISRSDKVVLNDWLTSHAVSHLQITKTSEWVQTVLASQEFWQEKNLLLLPDTNFSPENILSKMFHSLNHSELVAATFEVDDLRLWGGIKSLKGKTFVSEKISQPESGSAWGILGFSKSGGGVFWPTYLKAQASKKWEQIDLSFATHELDSFKDLTR